jgi:RNA polymerase sigma-70 factor (ECF subfamily)
VGTTNPAGGLLRIEMEMSEVLSMSVPLHKRRPAGTMYAVAAEPMDEELLLRVAERDEGAFEILYRRYARPMLALAMQRLGDRGRAEDAFQEAFVSVWRSASTYRPERGAAAAWLYAVARNAIADRARRRHEPPAEPHDRPALEDGPQERAEDEWVRWRVHRALEELPERERELIVLAYWSELSQSEIADRLEIPLGTVKSRTRSALGRLADVLDGELE